jgi:hypothetical protein
MGFGSKFEGGPIVEKPAAEKTIITPEFIKSVEKQTKIEQEKIIANLLEKMPPEEQAKLLDGLVELGWKESDAEFEKLKAEVDQETKLEEPVEAREIETNTKLEQEAPEQKKEKWWKKPKVVKSFTGICAALSTYAAFSYGPMEKKAHAGGPGFNIGDELSRSASSALGNIIRNIGQGLGQGAEDLAKRTIGGGLNPDEKRQLIYQKINLETTKAYNIQQMEMNEYRQMRQMKNNIALQENQMKNNIAMQEYRRAVEELRERQLNRREAYKAYTDGLKTAKSPEEVNLVKVKYKAMLEALADMEKK